MNTKSIAFAGAIAVLSLITGACFYEQHLSKQIHSQDQISSESLHPTENSPFKLGPADTSSGQAPIQGPYAMPALIQNRELENSVVLEKPALISNTALDYDQSNAQARGLTPDNRMARLDSSSGTAQSSYITGSSSEQQIAQMYSPMPRPVQYLAPPPQATRTQVRYASVRKHVRYSSVRKHHRTGKIHVSRAVKHAVLFTAKMPFKLRP